MIETVFYFNVSFKTIELINVLYFYMNFAKNILLKCKNYPILNINIYRFSFDPNKVFKKSTKESLGMAQSKLASQEFHTFEEMMHTFRMK